jgi:hypothetical protein
MENPEAVPKELRNLFEDDSYYSHETQMKQWCGHDYEIGAA